ncbi:MAG: diaminopimelate epimerase [Bacteroidales bacterium]|jgi:diaminopimelate epimerase|nr:diaminopimelate epimerase [Bacteroidales bacterium]
MIIFFSKYQANGNDFVIIDCRNQNFSFTEQQIQNICNRHFGIGADGVLLLTTPFNNKYDFEMKFFNPDGSSGMFCGNGGRSAVIFAKDLGIIESECCFIAPDGEHRAEIKNNQVKISMINPTHIKKFNDGWFINTGTQHFIRFVSDVNNIKIIEEGREIRYDTRFEKYKGTNVSFVQCLENGIKLRTYERGVEDETLSCGTAVVAASVIYAVKHNLHGQNIKINVSTQGGDLKVFIDKEGDKEITNVFLIGTTGKVFEGKIVI